jgi:Lon protease-like protein
VAGGPPELRGQSPLEEEDRSAADVVPIFPLPNVVLFPQQVLPLYIFEQRYRKMVNDAIEGRRLIGVSLLKPGWEEEDVDPEPHEVCGVGEVTQVTRLVGGNMNIILHCLARVSIVQTIQTVPYRLAEVEVLAEPDEDSSELVGLAERVRNIFNRTQALKPSQDRHSAQVLKLLANPIDIFNYLCAHSEFDVELKQELLEMDDLRERLKLLATLLGRDLAILN